MKHIFIKNLRIILVLERRVEIMFPVENPSLREKLMNILSTQLKDTEKGKLIA